MSTDTVLDHPGLMPVAPAMPNALNWIGGRWVDAAVKARSHDPATSREIGT